MTNRYLEKISAWQELESGVNWDPEKDVYTITREKVYETLKSKEEAHSASGAKTFGVIGGVLGGAMGAKSGGLKGAAIGAASGGALGAISGRALGNGGNRQLRENEGYVKDAARNYIARHHSGFYGSKIRVLD